MRSEDKKQISSDDKKQYIEPPTLVPPSTGKSRSYPGCDRVMYVVVRNHITKSLIQSPRWDTGIKRSLFH